MRCEHLSYVGVALTGSCRLICRVGRYHKQHVRIQETREERDARVRIQQRAQKKAALKRDRMQMQQERQRQLAGPTELKARAEKLAADIRAKNEAAEAAKATPIGGQSGVAFQKQQEQQVRWEVHTAPDLASCHA